MASNNNSPIKTRRRGRSLNRKVHKTRRNIRSEGPRLNYKKLGEGAYGIVHRPPYPCATNKNTYFKKYASDKYVSKFTDYIDATKEMEMANIIRELIPDHSEYYCLPEFMCDSAVTNVNRQNASLKESLVISPYCGVSLLDLIDSKTTIEFDDEYILYIIKQLQFVIEGVNKLHDNKITHNDLHMGNIMMGLPTKNSNYNTNPYNLLIADFGLAQHFNIYNSSSAAFLHAIRFDLHMLITEVLIPLSKYIVDIGVLYASPDKKIKRIDSMLIEFIKEAESKAYIGNRNSINSKNKDIVKLMYLLNDFKNIGVYIENNIY